MTQITGEGGKQNFIDFIREKITGELSQAYPELKTDRAFTATLANAVRMNGKPFIAIIDEWDSPIRQIPGMEQPYLEFLRTTFKSSGPASTIFSVAYMTGILPITKDGKASAVPDFEAHSVLGPDEFAGYVGFTEEEVKRLCEEKKTDFGKMKRWDDGYTVGNRHSIYNPYSVMHAARSGKFRSYWNKTSSAETLMTCMEMDRDDLQDTIARLIAGERVAVDTDSFRNDMVTLPCKDDVLTLLTHLGYLTREEEPDSCNDEPVAGLVRIPNEEVRSEFDKILRRSKHKKLIERVRKPDQLLKDTLDGKSDAVTKAIAEVHDCEYARTCSNEQSLRVVVKMAYISCVDQYARMEELPSGHGIADELSGMPVFVCYGTNRAVPDIPDRIRTTHQHDQLSALERAADPKTDFRAFFEWFMDREADEILRMKDAEDYEYTDPALQCVRKAIESVMGDVKGLRVKRSPVRMVVDKGGREIRVDLLSEGEKCTLAMIGDLARRLILANPAMENPLEGKGIVLIDEIELHMHPSWQRRILSTLKEVFPNIQFIVTTHSPQVLGEADESFKIISLSLDMDENGVGTDRIERMDGFDSNMIAGVFIRHLRMLKNDEDHA